MHIKEFSETTIFVSLAFKQEYVSRCRLKTPVGGLLGENTDLSPIFVPAPGVSASVRQCFPIHKTGMTAPASPAECCRLTGTWEEYPCVYYTLHNNAKCSDRILK